MTIRPATPEDGELAETWCHDHGEDRFYRVALPPIGCVAEDESGPAGMVWVYCACNIGVAFVEWLVTRPGLMVAQARRCGEVLMQGIEAAALALGYTVLVAYALPACARYLRGMGWHADERPKIAMVKDLSD